jgi:hypothetical protein
MLWGLLYTSRFFSEDQRKEKCFINSYWPQRKKSWIPFRDLKYKEYKLFISLTCSKEQDTQSFNLWKSFATEFCSTFGSHKYNRGASWAGLWHEAVDSKKLNVSFYRRQTNCWHCQNWFQNWYRKLDSYSLTSLVFVRVACHGSPSLDNLSALSHHGSKGLLHFRIFYFKPM